MKRCTSGRRSRKSPRSRATADFPANYMILDTRTHRRGVLQIMGVADNPRGVKIRYRLVEGAAGEEDLAKNAANLAIASCHGQSSLLLMKIAPRTRLPDALRRRKTVRSSDARAPEQKT